MHAVVQASLPRGVIDARPPSSRRPRRFQQPGIRLGEGGAGGPREDHVDFALGTVRGGRGGGSLGQLDDRLDRRVEQGVLVVIVGEGVLLEEMGQGDDHVACAGGGHRGGGRHGVIDG